MSAKRKPKANEILVYDFTEKDRIYSLVDNIIVSLNKNPPVTKKSAVLKAYSNQANKPKIRKRYNSKRKKADWRIMDLPFSL